MGHLFQHLPPFDQRTDAFFPLSRPQTDLLDWQKQLLQMTFRFLSSGLESREGGVRTVSFFPLSEAEEEAKWPDTLEILPRGILKTGLAHSGKDVYPC